MRRRRRAAGRGGDEALARLRAHARERDEAPPLETVSRFLSMSCEDASDLEEVRAGVADEAARNPRPVVRVLRALEALLAGPLPAEGTLARLVAWEANWPLDDPSDAGARAWLEGLAAIVRAVLDGAEPAPAQPDRS